MATWKNLAKDNRTASYEVLGHSRWRSCVSRAYYAVYSQATAELIRRGVTMPEGRQGPSHRKLADRVGNNLTGISHALRWRLAGIIMKLYQLRISADYVPSDAVGEDEARMSLGLMNQAFSLLGGKS